MISLSFFWTFDGRLVNVRDFQQNTSYLQHQFELDIKANYLTV